MDRVLGICTLIALLAALWSGRKRLEFNSFATTLLSLLELVSTAALVISLGLWGLAILAAVNVLAILAWSVVLALRVEKKLLPAATEAGESIAAMKRLSKRLNERQDLKTLGPIEKADLIKLLAERGRSTSEIEDMVGPIAGLKLLHDPPLDWLADRFDRILRLTDEPASEATQAAATISATAQSAAVSFTDIVEAFVTFYEGLDDVLAPEANEPEKRIELADVAREAGFDPAEFGL
jgi:hypothetical protein